VIAFLESPALIAELCKISGLKYKLIVSDRNTDLEPKRLSKRIKYFFYHFADFVTANSFSQGEVILKYAPKLRNKFKVIPNCVDTDKFSGAENTDIESGVTRIIAVGRISPQKNAPRFAEAMAMLKKKGYGFIVDWYGDNFFKDGKPTEASGDYLKMQTIVEENAMQDIFRARGRDSNIEAQYKSSDLLCLPSLWEGCPNVLCEAMACALPIAAGKVCDNGYYIKDGENGFLFDPYSPNDIADAVERFFLLNDSERKNMGIVNRKRALGEFSQEVFLDSYLAVINCNA